MSNQYQFIDKGMNLSSKGFIKDQIYTVSNRREIPNEPGKFMFTVEGPGLPKPQVLRESTIQKDFVMLEPVVQQPPVQQITPQQPPVQQPILNPNMQAAPMPQAQVPQAPTAPKMTAEQIVQTLSKNIDNGVMHLESILKRIETKPAFGQNAPIQAVVPQGKDLLLSELLKLDFVSCNIKIIKTEKDSSISVIVDGLPPLSVTAKDISAQDIVEKITATFTENAMVISSCREYVKRIQELNAEKEKEAKKAKDALDAAKKEALKAPQTPATKAPEKPAGKTSSPAVKKAEIEQKVQEQAQLSISESDPEDLPDEDLNDLPDPEEFPAAESGIAQDNGLSPEVKDFVL